jgi:hypothetical protein
LWAAATDEWRVWMSCPLWHRVPVVNHEVFVK